ncbi:MAG: ABC transporter ATP-binding protein [Candidatus Rokuibacteriota bacterium]
MPKIAIRFDDVSKRYRLHRGWHGSLRSAATAWLRRLGSRPGPEDVFWALKNVSFDIEKGDAVGLIGTNGAGKSTILKILSRVTTPSSGRFSTRGRVGALIEVGAGFHPELTGRDNVFLNGAIMGMSRSEVAEKFDRIVGFAEIEKFIDTPIKYYSSGMQVRLGFAVAAHIDPDVLLIDEVLAVGDASFQAKCLNKLAELKEQARTIVLVSHNLANIVEHSKKVLWVQAGTVAAYGDPDTVVDQYLKSIRERLTSENPADVVSRAMTDAERPIRIEQVTLCDRQGRVRPEFQHGEPVCIDIAYSVHEPVPDPVFEVTIQDAHGHALGGLTTRFDGLKIDSTQSQGIVRLILQPVLFLKGHYTVNVHIRDHQIQRYHDFRKRAAVLVVEGPSVASREVSGHVNYPHQWELP